MEIPKFWRLRKTRLSAGWEMPSGVAELWQNGDITMAQATSPDFWETDLCKSLLGQVQNIAEKAKNNEVVG